MRYSSLRSLDISFDLRKFLALSVSSIIIGIAAITPIQVNAHTHRHHRSQEAKKTQNASPIKVAGGYAHNAAIYMAGVVNRTRNSVVSPGTTVASNHKMTRHEIRLARHMERLAARHAHHQQRSVRVAKEDDAISNGDPVEAAYALRGRRYRMGGTSRSGFDCSGFVRYILSSTEGVDLPRTAREQYYNGKPVSREDLRPGDLVFFKNTYKHGISHVGIYTGNGRFVHAANSHKGVREDSLDTSYYANHYAGARRVYGLSR